MLTHETLSPRTGSLEVAIARGNTPADLARPLPADLPEDNFRSGSVDSGVDGWVTAREGRSPVCGGMVPEEISGPGEELDLHETPQASEATQPLSAPLATPVISESQARRFAARLTVWNEWQRLKAEGCTQTDAEKLLGVSDSTLSRMERAVAAGGLDALKDSYGNCGRTPRLRMTADEEKRLGQLYLRTNRTRDAGSMQTACKFFALAPETREELRTAILWDVEHGRVPRFCARVLKRITAVHIAANRGPKMLATQHFSGSVGAFADDKINRRRVVESDDGTLNFAAWIPWPQGGDPCSDKFGVRIGRWQFLPALECGWSHYYLGYVLVARPRGSYTQEDVRSVISMVLHQHGLPDEFRFERGTWESNSVVDLLKRLGVELTTVYQSNQKPFIEGGFSPLWTYLSMIDGQVGRYRGEMEAETRQLMKCQAGRANPSQHFPSLNQCMKAIDGALAMRNSDTIKSVYGSWVPEVRHKQLAEARPWQPLPADLDFLFAPWVREWTVQKGTVGAMVRLLPEIQTPCYFAHEELWRWNGRKVRVYFDPTQEHCKATIVSLQDNAGYKPGEIICQADLFGELPHFARAAVGWAHGDCAKTHASHRGPLSAVRREIRTLAPGGRVQAASSEVRDGHGNGLKVDIGRQSDSSHSSRPSHRSATPAPTRCALDDEDFVALGESDTPAPTPARVNYSVSVEDLEDL